MRSGARLEGGPVRVTAWLARHDPGFGALRRAGRAAILMPLLFLLGSRVIGSPDVAIFSAFGTFALLLFVDFGGPLRERVQAQTALALAGAVLVVLGTLAAQPVWLSAVAMAAVGFVVLFAGSVSSVTASAGTSLLLAFILPVTLPGTPESIGPRLLGWGIASAVSIVAITVLWPAPTREPLRRPAVEACRALAVRLRAEVAARAADADADAAEEAARTASAADDAVAALHESFLTTPYRPTGLSTPARTVVRLVDELTWLDAVLGPSGRPPGAATAAAAPASAPVALTPAIAAARRVRSAAADVLDEGAVLLAQHAGDPRPVEAALDRLAAARAVVESTTLSDADADHDADHDDDTTATARTPDAATSAPPRTAPAMVTALDPGFRAQELAFAVAAVGRNIALTARAERRSWWQRMLGRQPGDLRGPVGAAAERATGYAGRNSVWLRNSIRGAVALGLAVLLAKVSGVEHSFWVVLGTLSVLRSSALSTGQTVLRGVLGTAAGVVLGAGLMFLLAGGGPTLLLIVLPLAILVAGVAPAAISFTAGQAAFTVLLVLLFNIIAPAGWTVGLIRIEDIALGCSVSLVVGALFWPRGAAASLRKALADAYLEGVRYLRAAVAAGLGKPLDPTSDPRAHALRAAAASRRLDDAFRTYLADRGAKRRPLAEISSAVAGVAQVRLVSDAVLELWRVEAIDPLAADAARGDVAASLDHLERWYAELAARLVAGDPLPEPDDADRTAVERLAAAAIAAASAAPPARSRRPTVVRLIWTADYLEVVRRLERAIVTPVGTLRDDTAPRIGA
ncbi:FUSC family protein [Leifsonia sp. F6_8S_P_1B]|uniref:FUSC family protein n=1 Tax=Leifsonia williamsii TaxID=3035919 RepID=A0ABT8KAF7_9MICO|nr:FUSC family protein [Leifsonia williamsii]MDN4614157.1 FUSC family protein [Leifsonia williamsii]